jgi:DNA mismatch repair protein MutS
MADTPLMQQYKQIKSKNPDILLFFRLGDFYEMFGPDAKEGSRLLGLTLTARGDTPMCGVPYHSADTHIAKLLKAGKKVAICEQTSTEANPKTKLFGRDIVRIITPGTVLEESMLDAKTSNYLVGVEINNKGWGLACLEASTGDFWITENSDDAELAALSALLGSISPSEITATKESIVKLKAKIILPGELTLSPAVPADAEAAPASWPGVLQKTPLALKAGLLCLNYTASTNKDFKEYFVPFYKEITQFLQLGSNEARTLEIAASEWGGRKNTLWGTLDYCHTPMGPRLLKEWLLRPLLDERKINRRLDAVEALIKNEAAKDELAFILKEICDIERIMSRVAAGSAAPRDLAGLRASLQTVNKFEVWRGKWGALLPHLSGFFEKNAQKLKEISKLLYEAVSEHAPVKLSEGGIIKQGYNSELDELRNLKDNSAGTLQNIAVRERERTGISTLKIGFNSVFGYYIEVSKGQVGKVPYDYTRRQTLTNGERFITEELKELEKKILSAEEKSLRIELALFEEIRKYLYDNLEVLKTLAKNVAAADCFYSLAAAALNGGYTRPKILANAEALHIEKGRHPVVEQNIPAGSFVPNNLLLGGQGPQIMIITGPNMGGKSVYLKQTALITIMAQAGSFVPSSNAEVPLTDRILTRIGAQDVLSRGESTFMVEMKETANILACATPATLVLLDEVGRGTSTFDGISIAWAIAEFLHKPLAQGPKVLFATHYFELTELADKYGKIQNFHVDATEYKSPDGEVKLNFLFEIKPGPADKSYGIHVAEIAGLPRSCILRARKILKDLGERENTGIVNKEAQGPDLFSNPIVEEIKMVELDKITPLQAMQIIEEWKKRI